MSNYFESLFIVGIAQNPLSLVKEVTRKEDLALRAFLIS